LNCAKNPGRRLTRTSPAWGVRAHWRVTGARVVVASLGGVVMFGVVKPTGAAKLVAGVGRHFATAGRRLKAAADAPL
jgi:hypothetical protein